VGCYPRGASPWGIDDMVGNTYSWTRSRWGGAEDTPAFRYPYVADDGREALEGDDYRVVRGGAWSFPHRNSRCSYRGKDRPDDAFNNVGVRLVTRRNPAPRWTSPDAGKEQPS
jgi:iron(II)-dependent oxidoreductase